jgi:hypothetical protein
MLLELASSRLICHFLRLAGLTHAVLYTVKREKAPLLKNRQLAFQYETLIIKYLLLHEMPFKYYGILLNTILEVA